MAEVQFTVDEVCAILGLKHSTVVAYCRGRVENGERVGKRFPRSYIPYDAPKFGYRIPEGDLVAYARQQGQWLDDLVQFELNKRSAAANEQALQAV